MIINNKFNVTSLFFFGLAIIIVTPTLLFGLGQLSVIVTSSDQQPLPGVAVEICSPVLERIHSNITDCDGGCVFKDLPPGLYQIKCDLIGFKSILRKNFKIFTRAETLKLRMEKMHFEMVLTHPGQPLPIDPSITSFTFGDAILLGETSSSLYESVVSAWERMALLRDVCDRRTVLKEGLRNWKDILKKVGNKLVASPQTSEKRFMINAVFDGIIEHIRFDLSSISDFDQNALALRAELFAIVNFLKRVSDTGKVSFDLHIVSFPENIEVTYQYDYGGPVKKHPERTPTTIKDLYYSPCTLIFKQEGRTSVTGISYDPYDFLGAGIHQVRMNLLDKSQWESSYQNPPSLEERVSQSDLIIVGEVKHIECRRSEEGSDIYTYVKVSVEEYIKESDSLMGNDIIIRKLGGSIKEEGIIQYVERHPAGMSQPGFKKNDRLLLMLRLLPDSVHYEVVAGQHGSFSIMKDDRIAEEYISLREFIQKIKKFVK